LTASGAKARAGRGPALELALQTTLLGLAIAIILALVAALVGPVVIDWGHHRSLFETQATRLIGVDVQVKGAIDARLLPSPRLTLHDIEIGTGADAMRARSLGIEFALGSLLRGEWRATELRLAGPQLSLGLDSSGHLRAPSLAVTFNPDELSVEKLRIEDGTIVLTTAGGSNVTLERAWFAGEARSLIGPAKGEGAVTIGGKLYPFRIALGRLNEEGAMRLHLNVDPVDRLMMIEGDGALSFTDEPRFEGTWSLSRPVGINARGAAQTSDAVTQPWRVSGKIKTTLQSALMESVEFQYGSEDQGFKLTGVADLKFGTRPRFDGVLSGRQIDLDRIVASGDVVRPTVTAGVRRLADLSAVVFRPWLPIQIGVAIDQITLGGSTVQNLRGDITSSADGWSLDRLEFRAPGTTQVRLSGRMDVGPDGMAFTGPAEIDTSDPKTLAAWLEGRGETGQGDLRPTSLRGDVTLAGDKISVEGLKAEFERKPLTGRFAYFFPLGKPAKLEAELQASQFDFDGAFKFGRAVLAGTALERPREMALVADVGRATFDGIEARDVHARVKVDGTGLQIDQLSVADFGGGKFAASGRVETGGRAPRGALSVDLEATQTATVAALIEKFAPKVASPAKILLDRIKTAKLHGAVDIAGDDKAPATVAQLALSGNIDEMRIDTRVRASGDWQKPSAATLQINGTVDAPSGAPLIKLLSLDRVVGVGKGPGQLKIQTAGPVEGEMVLDLRVSASGLLAQLNGRGQLFDNQGIKLAGDLQVLDADLRPLRQATGTSNTDALPLKSKARVAIAGGTMTFDDIDAKIGDSVVRGRLSVDNASPRQIDGALEGDLVNGPALIASAIGLPGQGAGSWSSEPFGAGVFGSFSGKIALKLKNAEVLPKVAAEIFDANLRLSRDEVVLEDVTGTLAGGRFSGAMTLRSGREGLSAHAKVSLTGADAGALLPAAGTGSLTLAAETEGTGLSPVALIGALKGAGKIDLVDGQLAGLNPRTFDAATRAVDQGLVIETGRIADLVNKSLSAGTLSVKRVESVLSVSSGQLRLNNTVVESKDARLSITGMLDLIEGSINARLDLSGQSEAAGARPDISVNLKGPLTAPLRSVDVSALTAWLTLRSVENQTNRLRAIESAPPQPRERAAPRSKQAPALPAPIDIRPVPAPRSAGRPAASVDSQN